ncbi:OLC1v1034295C1 [Oldenlandia corymbosa var. corymbosa]|uniref:Growth-regulating factor n=1 Tax=Oldenlandia corymbosa var. corymbosa TaxID=529605 RepID=A0AAV1CQ98_OLDCO|nr:OLC1v1034295C1 [Oldenlandia corymbosa var. corymbosa]
MDFNLKQWREQQHQQLQMQQLHESEEQEQLTQTPPAKLPRLLFHSNHPQQEQIHSEAALPLFVTEPTTTTKLTTAAATNLSAFPFPAADSSSPAVTKYPVSRMGGGYFSVAQWQELELQALIFRHMLSGAAVPPELLHLVKKSIINTSSHPYYYSHPLAHFSHYQPAACSMDPEPRRCRRTDGKKWRCSRDVVAGQKYCERHVHRGRNRSRKPVENPTPAGGNNAANLSAGILKSNNSQPLGAMAGNGTSHFAFNGLSPSVDHLQFNQRSSDIKVETQNDAAGSDKSNGQILRPFFDDWPRRPLQQNEDSGRNNMEPDMVSNTNLSISISGNPTSDFSLKLSTGNRDDESDGDPTGNIGLERTHPNWAAAQWGTAHVSSMGGPLAEALRSSTSSSSPTSVLHQLQRGSASEASYISS